ncbi:MAG: ATP-binding protein, partial [Candidatus Njordarchaeota archaeon]
MSDYYKTISSLNDLVGDVGLLRLPSYIFDEYVFDDSRERALRGAVDAISEGKNVLITGTAGVGKTALMAIIIKNLIQNGYKIGYILEGAERVGNEHIDKGIILFYDDIPRMNKEALRSIVFNRVMGIIATSREEELDELRKKLGVPIDDVFVVFNISKIEQKKLEEILRRFARREGIAIDEEAVSIVLQKAQNLPVYVWQTIRDLKIQGKTTLDVEFAKKVPSGMLGYVEEILWRILDMHPDRYAVLLSLLIVSDLPKYEINVDLFYGVYAECLSVIKNKKIPITKAALSELFGKILKYFIKIDIHTFKLPHDSWGDVLKGKGMGLMSGEISTINSLFPYAERIKIVSRAIKRAQNEIITPSKEKEKIDSFKEFVSRLRKSIPMLGESMEKEIKPSGAKKIVLRAAIRRNPPKNIRSAKSSPIYRAIINNPVLWNVTLLSKRDLSKSVKFEAQGSSAKLIYPHSEKLKVDHKFIKYDVKILNQEVIPHLVFVSILLILSIIAVISLGFGEEIE